MQKANGELPVTKQLLAATSLQFHHSDFSPSASQYPTALGLLLQGTHPHDHLQNSPVYFKPTHSLHAEGLSQTLAPQGKLNAHREPASPPAPRCNTLRLTQAHKYISLTLPWNTALPALQSRHTAHIPSHRSNGLMNGGIRYPSVSDVLQRSELAFGAARTCIRQVFKIWGPEQVLHDGAEAQTWILEKHHTVLNEIMRTVTDCC